MRLLTYIHKAFSTLSRHLSAYWILRYSPTAQKGTVVYQTCVIFIAQVGTAVLRTDLQMHVPRFLPHRQICQHLRAGFSYSSSIIARFGAALEASDVETGS